MDQNNLDQSDESTDAGITRFQEAASALTRMPHDDLVDMALESHWIGRAIFVSPDSDFSEETTMLNSNLSNTNEKISGEFGVILVCLPSSRIQDGFLAFLSGAPPSVHIPVMAAFVEFALHESYAAMGASPDEIKSFFEDILPLMAKHFGEEKEIIVRALMSNYFGESSRDTVDNIDSVVVQDDESLAHVAQRVLGDSTLWVEIARINPELLPPYLLKPGQALSIAGIKRA